MLHHVSFSVRDPQAVASAIAELVDGAAIRAPSPPFPQGAWFAVLGDGHGSLFELLPWGVVVDPEAPGGLARDPQMAARSASHVLVRTPRSPVEVIAIAQRLGWRTKPVDAGLFRFTKLWTADGFLLELLSPEQADDYAAAFAGRDFQATDTRLRNLEREVAAAMRG